MPVTRYLMIASISLLCLGLQPGGAQADGPSVFKQQKCTKCHSAPAIEGGKRDLAGVGKKHTAEWMTKFLKKEIEREGKKHKKKFKGTDPELELLVKWLSSLK